MGTGPWPRSLLLLLCSQLPETGWQILPGMQPQLALAGLCRGGGFLPIHRAKRKKQKTKKKPKRLTDGTFSIPGFSYLCLPPPWCLKLPVFLKSGGTLPRAHGYITRYFQLNAATFPATGVSLRTAGLCYSSE